MGEPIEDYGNPFDRGPIGDEPGKFLCPVCKSETYRAVLSWTRDGRNKQTSLFQCIGCSVVFTNVEHFTSGRRVVLKLSSPLNGVHVPVIAREEGGEE